MAMACRGSTRAVVSWLWAPRAWLLGDYLYSAWGMLMELRPLSAHLALQHTWRVMAGPCHFPLLHMYVRRRGTCPRGRLLPPIHRSLVLLQRSQGSPPWNSHPSLWSMLGAGGQRLWTEGCPQRYQLRVCISSCDNTWDNSGTGRVWDFRQCFYSSFSTFNTSVLEGAIYCSGGDTGMSPSLNWPCHSQLVLLKVCLGRVSTHQILFRSGLCAGPSLSLPELAASHLGTSVF